MSKNKTSKKAFRKEFQLLEWLDNIGKEKVLHFIRLLLNQSKYRKLKKEIAIRRKEIKNGDTLTHNEIWYENEKQRN